MSGTALTLLAFVAALIFVTGVAVLAQGTRQRRDIESIGRRSRRQPALKRFRIAVDSALLRTTIGRALIDALRPSGLQDRALEVIAAAVLAATFFGVYLPSRTTYLIAVLLLIATGFAARAHLRRRRDRRVEAFVAQLPDLARMLSNGVAAGQALPSALARAARELDEPAGSTLTQLTDQLRLGQSLEAALERLTVSIPSRELLVLVSTLVIQQRAGGDAVKALRGMSVTLEERKDLQREIRTILAGVRAITVAVIVLGVGSLVLLNSVNDAIIAALTDTAIGNVVLISGFGLIGVGVAIIRRFSKVEL